MQIKYFEKKSSGIVVCRKHFDFDSFSFTASTWTGAVAGAGTTFARTVRNKYAESSKVTSNYERVLKFGRVKHRLTAIKHTRTCFVNTEQVDRRLWVVRRCERKRKRQTLHYTVNRSATISHTILPNKLFLQIYYSIFCFVEKFYDDYSMYSFLIRCMQNCYLFDI